MTDPIKAQPVAWMHDHPGLPSHAFPKSQPLPRGAAELGWTETPLYTHAQLVEERRLAWNEAIEAAATIADHHRKARRAAHNEAHRRGAKRQATSALGRSLEAQQLMVAIRALTKDTTHD